MTFDELFAEHHLTPEERQQLVAHLATLRATATLRAFSLCKCGKPAAVDLCTGCAALALDAALAPRKTGNPYRRTPKK